jgi:hypothetical protein
MKRWSLAAAAAGFLAVCVAVPAQAAAEFCLADPPLSIQTSPGDSFTVYVTEGVWGSEHQAALGLATLSYRTSPVNKKSLLVTVNDSIPTDSSGTFATMMIVSSQPFGHGVVYGSSTGTSGSTMSVSFGINPQKVTG